MRQNLKTSKSWVVPRFTMYRIVNQILVGIDADAPNSWYGAGAVEISGPSNSMTIGTISSSKVLGQPAAKVIHVEQRNYLPKAKYLVCD